MSLTQEDVQEAVAEARARDAAGYQIDSEQRFLIMLADENTKLRQELALYKLTRTSEELGGYE